MIFLLETKSKKPTSVGLMANLLRGVVAILVLALGAIALTMAATLVITVGSLLAVLGTLWWFFSGKKQFAKLKQQAQASVRAYDSPSSRPAGARSSVVIEGELVRETGKAP